VIKTFRKFNEHLPDVQRMVKHLPSVSNALSIPVEPIVVNSAVLPRELLKSRDECLFFFLVLPECVDFFYTLSLLQCHTKRSVVLGTLGFNNFVALGASHFRNPHVLSLSCKKFSS